MRAMLAPERRKIILEKLQADKKVIVSQLSIFFGVSDETIRRDIDQLCQEGLAVKCYGGATINENGPEMPFNIRKLANPTEKQKIATIIADLIDDGENIILDASTTAVFVAKKLKQKKRLTIVTNSIDVMLELSDMDDFTVICTGGRMMGSNLAFVGQRVISALSSFYADKLIFSCKAIQDGIYDSNDDSAEVKRHMCKSAKTKILAADTSKFDKTAFAKISDISGLDMIVTNTCPGEQWLSVFNNVGVKCIYE